MIGIGNFSDAQFRGYVRSKTGVATRRAVQQTDNEIDKKINNAVDTLVSNAFNKDKGEGDQPDENGSQPSNEEKQSQSGANSSSDSRSGSSVNDVRSKAIMGKLGISMERPDDVKDIYNYTGNVLMAAQSWDSIGNTKGEELFTTHYTADNKGFAMDFKSKDNGDSRMIFDYENQILIILSHPETQSMKNLPVFLS